MAMMDTSKTFVAFRDGDDYRCTPTSGKMLVVEDIEECGQKVSLRLDRYPKGVLLCGYTRADAEEETVMD